MEIIGIRHKILNNMNRTERIPCLANKNEKYNKSITGIHDVLKEKTINQANRGPKMNRNHSSQSFHVKQYWLPDNNELQKEKRRKARRIEEEKRYRQSIEKNRPFRTLENIFDEDDDMH